MQHSAYLGGLKTKLSTEATNSLCLSLLEPNVCHLEYAPIAVNALKASFCSVTWLLVMTIAVNYDPKLGVGSCLRRVCSVHTLGGKHCAGSVVTVPVTDPLESPSAVCCCS